MAKLADIGKIVTGNTPKTSEKENYTSKDICFVKPSDILEHDITYLEGSEFYISESARNKARIVPPQSILITCIGIIGKVAVNQVECAFNQQINAIIPDLKICIPSYLACAIQHKKNEMQNTANAAVVPILNRTQFSNLEIHLPQLDEQIKISAVLGRLTSLISLRKQQLAKLDELVKVRFVEMFGAYPSNEKGWEVGTIRDIVADVRYGTSRPAVDGGTYPYLRMNNITYDGQLDLSDVKRIDIPDNELSKCTVKRGDVLFNRTNSKELVGKTCVYDKDEMMVLAGFIIRVRVNDRVLPEFLASFLNADFSKKMLLGMCKAAIGQANINAQELQNIGLYLPPVPLQHRFVDFKTHIDRQKLTIQQSLDKLEVLKKALMQEYFG